MGFGLVMFLFSLYSDYSVVERLRDEMPAGKCCTSKSTGRNSLGRESGLGTKEIGPDFRGKRLTECCMPVCVCVYVCICVLRDSKWRMSIKENDKVLSMNEQINSHVA